MAFDLNRIDGTRVLTLLQPENVSVHGDEAMIELFGLSADYDIELYFPAPGGVVDYRWLETARDVLIHLTSMDNEVQRVGAEQWARTSYPSSHYEGDLIDITLIRSQEVVLHYTVVGCNSDWDERFVCKGGQWVRIEPASPTPHDSPDT